MKISTTMAAARLGLSRSVVREWLGYDPLPEFLIFDGNKYMVETEHPAWEAEEKRPRMAEPKKQNQVSGRKRATKKKAAAKKILYNDDDRESEPLDDDVNVSELERRSILAGLNDTIYAAKIKEEKSKQEQIKTLELKKELAPIYLVKHFFGFAERMIHRGYRRYHEIIPELSALIMAGKTKEAEQLLIKEQETIVFEAKNELIKAIEEEGYRVKKKEMVAD